MAEERKGTSLKETTRRRIGRYFNAKYMNWDTTINRVLDILEGTAYHKVPSVFNLEDERVPDFLPPHILEYYKAIEDEMGHAEASAMEEPIEGLEDDEDLDGDSVEESEGETVPAEEEHGE